MLNRLGSIIKLPFRQAENTDTHQYIRRQERDSQKQKHSDYAEDDTTDLYDDAVLSLDALELFLKTLQKSAEEKSFLGVSQQITQPKKQISKTENVKSSAQNPDIHQALSAYSHAAETSPNRRASGLGNGQEANGFDGLNALFAQDSPQDSQDRLSAEQIISMLKDIAVLKSRGQRDIRIERADTFLKSILTAIEKALQS
ncbi:MAG: hypothetical protein ACK4VI_04490 [Alphaproteobacteria bacterium]